MTDVAGLTFEEAIAQLETVVERLESGELTLDESLLCFEEGVALQRRCVADLTAAQGKIEQLSDNGAVLSSVVAGDPAPRAPHAGDGVESAQRTVVGPVPGDAGESLFGLSLPVE